MSRTHVESQSPNQAARLNWLRAGVLGANDGIVSISGLVIGVAGATNNTALILTAGIAGIVAGGISMAAGEYVSVSSQRDSEHALLEKEKLELKNMPREELKELASLYEKKGLSKKTALVVAKELTKKDAFAAHVDIELGIDPKNLTNAWQAAIASATSFLVGAIIPLIAIIAPPAAIRVPVAFSSVVIALAITGIVSGKIGKANIAKAVARVVLWGVLAMTVTYTVGKLFNVQGI